MSAPRAITAPQLAAWLCLLMLLMLLALLPRTAAAQDFHFTAPPSAGHASTPAAMRDLAERILPVYEEKDTDRYLTNLAALQLVAATWTAADDTRRSLRERRRSNAATGPVEREVLYDIYAQARAIETRDKLPFAQAFTAAFREVVPKLNDRDAHALTQWFEKPLPVFQQALDRDFERWRGRESIALADAVELIWTYLAFDAHRSFRPLVAALDVEEERRRYVLEESVAIKLWGGGVINAQIVRPKNANKPLPALLAFTLDPAEADAKGAAAHGYVGVVAYSRVGSGKNRGAIEPFRRDGADARAVLRWIAKQPWSDGRVGMYGEGYSGFAAWAALKRPAPELKAIATASPMAPGIDFPSAGRIVPNAAYRWAHRTTGNPKAGFQDDDAGWQALEQAWYRSGRPYRDLERRFGPDNPVFRTWLSHPSYDRYWQKTVPYGADFAQVQLPVLTIAGTYAADAGALHYFREHLRQLPTADHRLLLGPWDAGAIRGGPAPVLRGYPVDASALVDLRELRYQWFDSVFKGSALPALLKDRVNYQLAGANEWRHAPTLKAMASEPLRYYLQPSETGERHRLLSKPLEPALPPLQQSVDLRERIEAPIAGPAEIVARSLRPAPASLSFASEPLAQATEFAGQVSGLLDLSLNKQDVDLRVTLYEQLPGGSTIQLFEPYEFRASYAADRVHRRLLKNGLRQPLRFTTERLGSRRLGAGSRVLMVLAVSQRADRQLNYGSGKEVSLESVKDARQPLKIQWYGGSYIELPIRK